MGWQTMFRQYLAYCLNIHYVTCLLDFAPSRRSDVIRQGPAVQSYVYILYGHCLLSRFHFDAAPTQPQQIYRDTQLYHEIVLVISGWLILPTNFMSLQPTHSRLLNHHRRTISFNLGCLAHDKWFGIIIFVLRCSCLFHNGQHFSEWTTLNCK